MMLGFASYAPGSSCLRVNVLLPVGADLRSVQQLSKPQWVTPARLGQTRLARVRCCASSAGDDLNKAEIATPLDGDIRAMFEEGVRAQLLSDEELRASDARVVDGITEGGREELRTIADEVVANLEEVSRSSVERGEEILEQELQRTLDQYEERQNHLVQGAIRDRDIIHAESERIKALAESLGNHRATKGSSTPLTKQNILFAVVVMLNVAALAYSWQAFVESSPEAMRNAVIDCGIAAAAMYFYNRDDKFTQ